jgi:hypothetical protein
MFVCLVMALFACVVAADRVMVAMVNNGQDDITVGVAGLAVVVVLFLALYGALRRLFGHRLSSSRWPV